jgi:hypothetical protein
MIHPRAHSACGALEDGIAVCDGISAAFSLLAAMYGFQSGLVYGKAGFGTAHHDDHVWNIIRVGDHYYHVDVTWAVNDYQKNGTFSYDYFCQCDDDMMADYSWNRDEIPVCDDSGLSFYAHSGLIAENRRQADDILRASLFKSHEPVRLKLAPDVVLPGTEENYLLEKTAEFASFIKEDFKIEYTWNDKSRCFSANVI